MRTYTHGVIGYLLYARRSGAEQRLAIAGGVLPDLFLALGFIFHYGETMTSFPLVADLHTLLHHSTLHTVTVAMHSFVVVGLLLGLSYLAYRTAVPFFIGMLAHGAADLLTHTRWAYNHLFPIPADPVRGIVSYTGLGFTIAEHAFVLLFAVWFLLRRNRPSSGGATVREIRPR